MPTPQEFTDAAAALQRESDQAVALLTQQQTDLVNAAAALQAAIAESASKDELIAAANAMLTTVGGVVTALDKFTPEGTPTIPTE